MPELKRANAPLPPAWRCGRCNATAFIDALRPVVENDGTAYYVHRAACPKPDETYRLDDEASRIPLRGVADA